MAKCDSTRQPARKALSLPLLLSCVAAAVMSSPLCAGFVGAKGAAPSKAPAQTAPEWTTLRMRSFAPGASGRVSVEPTNAGGRVRLTALSLPQPRSAAPTARAYVVWAASEGRAERVGELQVDARGNGGFEFERPADFERYSVIVTAEPDASAARPAGAPVLSTKAGEVRAVFARPTREAASPSANAGAGARAKAPKPEPYKRTYASRAGDFYTEVDNALDAGGGGRRLELEGVGVAPAASGDARATAQSGNAYVRVRFRDLPLPSAVGANTYVLWGSRADGRIVYMGSLPANSDLNQAYIYVRTASFHADDYYLFVTAERQRPAARPSDRRALAPRQVKVNVK